jgi:hypothetical protein
VIENEYAAAAWAVYREALKARAEAEQRGEPGDGRQLAELKEMEAWVAERAREGVFDVW